MSFLNEIEKKLNELKSLAHLDKHLQSTVDKLNRNLAELQDCTKEVTLDNLNTIETTLESMETLVLSELELAKKEELRLEAEWETLNQKLHDLGIKPKNTELDNLLEESRQIALETDLKLKEVKLNGKQNL